MSGLISFGYVISLNYIRIEKVIIIELNKSGTTGI